MINKNIFRAYDIRGIVEKDITDEVAYKIGRGFGHIVRKTNKNIIAISGDVRPSTDKLLQMIEKGLKESGINVINLGTLPTPVNYFCSFSKNIDVDGSIQITGSHNPSEYNGFKITLDKKPYYGDDNQNLYKTIV